jgi:hypothetical protein
MGRLRSRIRHLLAKAEKHKVTLSCQRCGYQVDVAEDVPVTLFTVAFAQLREDDDERVEEHNTATLDAVLSHPCVEGNEGGKPWAFVEGDPNTDEGSLAALANSLTRCRQQGPPADLSEQGSRDP